MLVEEELLDGVSDEVNCDEELLVGVSDTGKENDKFSGVTGSTSVNESITDRGSSSG